MLAAGRTNPEIAAALGVTLAGAKWHVSELISRLGVSSREEAADYWREQNRLPRRLSRSLRGLFGAGLWKAMAIGGAAGGVVAATVALGAMVNAASSDAGPAAEPRAPAFTEAEARERARFIAGEYLKQTNIPQLTTVAGHPLTIDDLDLVKFAAALTSAPAGHAALAGWSATFRREDISMPDMGWTDGMVTVTVLFEDGTGKVRTANARRGSKGMEAAQPPPPAATPDFSAHERVGPFIPILRVDGEGLHQTLNIYRTQGGDWCWWNVSDRGSASGSCSVDPGLGPSPDIFGVSGSGPGAIQGQPTAGYAFAVLSARVDHVELVFEDGNPLVLPAIDFPPETGLTWRAFGAALPADRGNLLVIRALATDGSEIAQFPLRHGPDVPPYIVMPLDYVDFSGTGNSTGGAFRLPPPAFPVKIALLATHDDSGPIIADLVCDTGVVRIIDQPGAVGAPSGSLVIDLPPGATTCAFDVHASGHWSFVTK